MCFFSYLYCRIGEEVVGCMADVLLTLEDQAKSASPWQGLDGNEIRNQIEYNSRVNVTPDTSSDTMNKCKVRRYLRSERKHLHREYT
jgi:hypothetical protein